MKVITFYPGTLKRSGVSVIDRCLYVQMWVCCKMCILFSKMLSGVLPIHGFQSLVRVVPQTFCSGSLFGVSTDQN